MLAFLHRKQGKIANVEVMESAKLDTFSYVRRFSTYSVVAVSALSLVFSSWLGAESLNWQVIIAIIALAVGIPHGALDHLVTLPRTQPAKMALFIAIYVAIALVAIWAILQWNVWGFVAVVIMSATHFGIGDSAYIAELNNLGGKKRSRLATWSYALAAGFIPVAIPLINSRSTEALEKVNPALVDWHQGFDSEILIAIALLSTVVILILARERQYRDLIDLISLIALVSFAPPLVAFATYFGCWHAMRHTARLTSLLPQSQAFYSQGRSFKAFQMAVVPGLPALVGTLIFVLVLAAFARESISDKFLWLTLVTIWALTVPHMVVTSRLDRIALKK
jgi:Brp/Blh family beta-carotene 15,15'-monooxygenase